MADNNDTRTDPPDAVELLVEFWHSTPVAAFLDEAARDVLGKLQAAPSRPPVADTVIHAPDPADTLKMIRETFCLAQSAINQWPSGEGRKPGHVARLQRLIDDIDDQRPLGTDGKHGDRHTPTCGCEDKA